MPRPFADCHQSFTAEKFPKDNFIVVLLEIMFKFGLHAVHIHLECLKQRQEVKTRFELHEKAVPGVGGLSPSRIELHSA